jgi:hypothetical protein
MPKFDKGKNEKCCAISGFRGGEYGRAVVDIYRRFRGAYCLHHQGDEWP